MEIRLKDLPDVVVMGDKREILKMHILMKSLLINILNLKEILLDLVTIHQIKKAKAVLSLLRGKNKTMIVTNSAFPSFAKVISLLCWPSSNPFKLLSPTTIGPKVGVIIVSIDPTGATSIIISDIYILMF